MTTFLIAAALLILGGLLFVLWPLLQPVSAARYRAGRHLSIYRDQFTELERDLKLGTLVRPSTKAPERSSSGVFWTR